MSSLEREKLAELMPSLVRVFSSREEDLLLHISTLREICGLSTSADLDEAEQLIARGCTIVRDAIERAAAKGPSAP